MKKLAITFAGAVSLGAFEAGVAYELVRALRCHNKHIDDSKGDPAQRIAIDVLTGASAGGMTAALLAQKLLFQADRLDGEYDNDLYLPWVKDIDLLGLLREDPNVANLSVLSSNLIEEISSRYLTDGYSSTINPAAPSRHLASDSAIHIGLAMSNLDGIDYGVPLASGDEFIYTRFQDEVKVLVDSSKPAHNSTDFWEAVRNAAVACGAFPFAFRVKTVSRSAADYDPPPEHFPATGMRFAYTDGGVFQNEPLGLAKDLVDLVDRHVNDERYYIFVAPGLPPSKDSGFGGGATNPTDTTIWNTAKQLGRAILYQAGFRDWILAEKVNARVENLDRAAYVMRDQILSAVNPLDGQALGHLAEGVLAGFMRAPEIADARTRLKLQYAADYTEIEHMRPGVGDGWISALILVEHVADLGPRDRMTIYGVTAGTQSLAGNELFAFAGFFDIRYRRHDYDCGRQAVRDFVNRLNNPTPPFPKGPGQTLGPIYYLDAMVPLPIDHTLDTVAIADLDHSKRSLLKQRALDRADSLMQELGLNGFVRGIISDFFLNGYLSGKLQTQAPPPPPRRTNDKGRPI